MEYIIKTYYEKDHGSYRSEAYRSWNDLIFGIKADWERAETPDGAEKLLFTILKDPTKHPQFKAPKFKTLYKKVYL